jgi:hypothetical protein
MRWDRFFEDLEDQLASEWDAERAALDSEAERLRLSRLGLRDRLAALARAGAATQDVGLDLIDGTVLRARIAAVGADWVGMDRVGDAERRAGGGGAIVPLAALAAVSAPEELLLRSARPTSTSPARLSERMTIGFVLRDIARRRVPASVQLRGGRMLSGTIDRVGLDHLDLALHDPGAARRPGDLTGVRLVSFGAIAWVRLDALASLP